MELSNLPTGLLLALGLPLALVCTTAYAKVLTVLSLVRTGLGPEATLPGPALHGLAAALTLVVMWPVGVACAGRLVDEPAAVTGSAITQATAHEGQVGGPLPNADWAPLATFHRARAWVEVVEPWRQFCAQNADPREVAVVHAQLAGSLGSAGAPTVAVAPGAWVVVVPAFLLTELREALAMALLLLLPFVLVDLLVAAAATALSVPASISERVALLLRIALLLGVGGWTLLARGLWLGYVLPGGGGGA
jgi:type III secretory pathway component EscR